MPVLAPSARLRGQLFHGVLEPAQPVAGGIVPCRVKQHRPREKLRARQVAPPPGEALRMAVIAQAPAGIEGLAEDDGAMAGKDRLEPELGGHGIDGRGPLHQRKW